MTEGPFLPSEATNRVQSGLAKDASAAISTFFIATVFNAIGGILIARLLGPAGRGVYVLCSLAAIAAAICLVAGTDLWATRELARRSTTNLVRRVVRRQATFAFLALLAIAVVVTSIGVISHIASNDLGPDVAASLGFAVATVAYMLAIAQPLGRRAMGPYASGILGDALFSLAFVVAFVVLDVRTVAWVLGGVAVGRVAAAIMCRWMARRVLLDSDCTPADLAQTSAAHRSALAFGVPGAIAALLTLAIYRLDVVVVAVFMSTRSVGLYSAAAAVTEGFSLLPDALSQVLMPHVSARPERRDVSSMVRLAMVTILAAGLPVAIFGASLMTLIFGTAFRDGAKALPPLVLAVMALAAWKLLVADLAARGNTRSRATSAALGLTTMIVSDMALVPAFGIVGAGVGAALGYAIAAVFAALVWHRATGEPLRTLVGMRATDGATILAALRAITRRP
jgi:O-antigen/teichoic acid export membrane protein